MPQSRATQESESIAQSRLLMFEQRGSSITWPFLTVLIFWTCVLFLGFGLFARFNATVTVALLVGALSVAGAFFLVLELSEPYRGLMQISDAPLRNAMAQIHSSSRSLYTPPLAVDLVSARQVVPRPDVRLR
jgi:hypothetical protein